MKARLLQDAAPKTFALVFDKGDEVVAGLTEFARAHGLSASHFTAIGAFSDVTVGDFLRDRKQYRRILEAHVWPTLKVVVEEAPSHLARRLDPETGFAVIALDEPDK